MPNKNRQTGELSPVVRQETKVKEARAILMDSTGIPLKEIASELGVSVARVREYLK